MVSDAQVTVALRAACLHDTRESRKDMRKALEAALLSASPVQQEGAAPKGEPIDMVLFCPKCGMQHIDAPDERTPDWKNEPHRSHLCHGCGHIWRPADVPTNGVEAVKTAGKADSPLAAPARAPIGEQARALWRAIGEEAEAVVQGGRKYLLLTEEMCVRLGAALAVEVRKENGA
jgi:hypothetical protein